MYYSKSRNGFFRSNTETDSVKITDERHKELLKQQSQGLQIVPDENGYPLAVDPLSLLSAEEIYQREYASVIARRKARYKETDALKAEIEFDAMVFGAVSDLTPWVEAVQQVKADLPLPVKEA